MILRIKKDKPRGDLELKYHTVKKEINVFPEIYSDVYSTLQKSQAKVQIETFLKPKKSHELKLGPQQHHFNRGRSRRLLKHLKTRSIAGASYEVDDNQLNKLIKSPPEVRDEEPIHIEPVLRVTTKKNVFDSVVDILRQLLDPPKNELGPLVGPIQIPGSGRKIYLRLMEPVGSSHVMVRFVTQVPVPVIDSEPKHGPVIPIPPIIDPAVVLLKSQHTVLSDAVFASSRHLHRNANQTIGKARSPQFGKSSVLNSPKSLAKDLRGTSTSGKESLLPDKGEENKSPFVELNLENHENPFLSEPNSYYPYQKGEDAVKQLLNDTTTVIENSSKDPPGTWYELSTHRLPLRQVAPLYPLTSIEHSESSSYKMPSDILTGPSLYTSPYVQFNNANSGSYTNSYDQHYDASNSYSMSPKPNDVHTITSSYSTSYQKQNEFNSSPSSYPIPYHYQNEFNNVSNSHSTFYKKQNDLYGTSSSYSKSYDKSSNAPSSTSSPASSSSYEKYNGGQIVLSSNDALRIIDPPSYISSYQRPLDNYANRSSNLYSSIRQPRYNLQNLKDIGLNAKQRDDHQVIWDDIKQEKSKSSLRQNRDFLETNDRDKWQPVVYERENTDWHEGYVDLAKIANNHHETKQLFEGVRKTSRNVTSSSLNRGSLIDRRQNISRRRNTSIPVIPILRYPVSSKEKDCEQVKPALTSNSEKPTVVEVVEKHTQSTMEIEPIVVIASKTETNNITENIRLLGVTTKSPTSSSTTSSSTERSLPLIVTTKNPMVSSTTKIPLPLIRMTKSPVMSSTTERFIVSLKTNRPIVNNMVAKPTSKPTMKPTSSTAKSSAIGSTTAKNTIASNDTAKKLPKRPMVMKKPTFIMKRVELSSTTQRTIMNSTTQKSMTNSAMKKTLTTRNSTFRGAISRIKSNAT